MPKNKTLIADIVGLAATLELDGVVTEGLNNEALVALKKELKSQVEAKGAQGGDDTEEPKAEEPKAEEPKAEEPKAEEPKAEEPKAEEPKASGPVVAPGKSLITLKGVIGEGKPIKPSDLGGGEKTFRELKKSGYIVE